MYATSVIGAETPAIKPDGQVNFVTAPLKISEIADDLKAAYERFAKSKMTDNEKNAALVWVSNMSQRGKAGKKLTAAMADKEKRTLAAQLAAIPDWEQNAIDMSIRGQAMAFIDALRETVKDTANVAKYLLPALGVLAAAGLLYIGYSYVKAAARPAQQFMNINK